MACAGCNCSESQRAACSSSTSDAVKLPLGSRKGHAANSTPSETTPLWPTTSQKKGSNYGGSSVEEAADATLTALPPSSSSPSGGKCGHPVRSNGGVCCRELKPSDERTLISPDVVRDIIIGLSDGLTVPLALTAGLSGVGSTRIVVLAGAAELISGAVSMGVGGFLSAQAELQHYNFTLRQTQERMRRTCSTAIADEVCDILGPYGVPRDVAALVASKLHGVELSRGAEGLLPTPASMANDGADANADADATQGLTPFILRLGEGLEPISSSRAWQSAITIGMSYFIGGLLPLFPYIFLSSIRDALFTSIAVTGVVLVVFGIVKQRWTGGAQGWGYLYGAASTLAVGGLAAGCSWLAVRTLEGGGA